VRYSSAVPRAGFSEPMSRSAYSLMANTVLTSVLGLAFWLAAARLFPANLVGDDSALIAAITVLTVVGSLDLGTVLIRFLPTAGLRTARIVAGAYTVSVSASLLLAVVFVVLAPRLSTSFAFLGASPPLAITFCVIASLWAVFSLQDFVLVALHRALWVAVENTVFGILKLAALPILVVTATQHAVFVAWVGPVIPLIIAVNLVVARRMIPSHVRRQAEHGIEQAPLQRRAFLAFVAFDYLASMFNQASARILPVLVVVTLGGTSNAYFYIAFTIITAFDLLFQNVTMSLVVEASADEQHLQRLTQQLVRRFLVFVLVGGAIIIVAAPLLLLPFGPAYADNAAPVLRLLVLASGFRAILALFGAVARVRGHTGWLLLTYACLAALLLPLAVILVQRVGLNGVALAWLIAHAVVGTAVLWPMIRLLRTSDRGAPMFGSGGTAR
jgi:O-antigen/teichoic acid export membrane protein